MRFIKWLRHLFNAVVTAIKIKKSPPEEVIRTVVMSEPIHPEEVIQPEKSIQQEASGGNRSERRKLERLRRKHDKFIDPKGAEPKGSHPLPAPRTERKKKEKEAEKTIVNSVNGGISGIIGPHHENIEGDDVLFEEAELYGEFNFRDTILQQLERYFVYIDRMKKRDANAYELYRQYGATILPYLATGSNDRRMNIEDNENKIEEALPSWFNKTRPAFGCFVYGADPETEKHELIERDDNHALWVPKFMYFTKYVMPPPTIQPMSGGDVYSMTVWWDRPFDKTSKIKYGAPQSFAIYVSRDGSRVEVLRTLETKYIDIHSKRKHETFTIPRRAWKIPDVYKHWAKTNNYEDVKKFLSTLFIQAVRMNETAQYSMVRVAATKGDVTAVFGVNIKKMAYFFKDRDIELTKNGSQKRVFHMVRAHIRHTKNGDTPIKFQFRGEREFTWAGYNISITVPGRDHAVLSEFDYGSIDDYWVKKGERKDFVSEAELGKKFKGYIKHGVGGMK